MNSDFLVLGVIWYIVFLFSTTCHEGAHALVAKLGGDTTAFEGGQVSLNPLPHIRREPFGLVVVPIFSYIAAHWMIGWASAPYNPEWQQRYPRRFYSGHTFRARNPGRNSRGDIRAARVGQLHSRCYGDRSRYCRICRNISKHPVRIESSARDFQPAACAAARWEYRHYTVHERNECAAIY
jgi:hypothetical protein